MLTTSFFNSNRHANRPLKINYGLLVGCGGGNFVCNKLRGVDAFVSSNAKEIGQFHVIIYVCNSFYLRDSVPLKCRLNGISIQSSANLGHLYKVPKRATQIQIRTPSSVLKVSS